MKIIDYGKKFVPHGTTDFLVLSASDEAIAKSVDYFRRNVLLFPSNTSFVNSLGRVSVGLLSFPAGYLFVQIQSRREDELAEEQSTMRRPFTQVRFSVIEKKEFVDLIREDIAIYTSLLYNNANTNKAGKKFRLPDYGWFKEDEAHVLETKWKSMKSVELTVTKSRFQSDLEGLFNFLYKSLHSITQDELIYNINFSEADPTEDIVYYQLALLEKVQRKIYPFFPDKIITFALDNITRQRVTIRFSSQHQN